MYGVGFLIDTNVISEIRKARVDAMVAGFFDGVASQDLFLSVLTIGELRKGAFKKIAIDPVFASRLALWVDELEIMFANRILPIDMDVARIWGEQVVARSLPVIDSLIAATALKHRFTLVTRNVRDVKETGVRLLNPWEEAL